MNGGIRTAFIIMWARPRRTGVQDAAATVCRRGAGLDAWFMRFLARWAVEGQHALGLGELCAGGLDPRAQGLQRLWRQAAAIIRRPASNRTCWTGG